MQIAGRRLCMTLSRGGRFCLYAALKIYFFITVCCKLFLHLPVIFKGRVQMPRRPQRKYE